MKKGDIIIFQPCLEYIDDDKILRGYPDLLVRSDYVNILLDNDIIDEEESKLRAPYLGKNYHYKVIDIKNSKVVFLKDGIHISNDGNMKFNKCQLYIYTMALNKLQKIDINKAYIWGKNYSDGTHFLKMLGTLDYDTVDNKYVNITNNAINWLIDLYENGHTWSLEPKPSRPELYPNMKIKDEYYDFKLEYNRKIKDLTSLYKCGVKKRTLAHTNGIKNYDSPKLTASAMQFKGNDAAIFTSMVNSNKKNNDTIFNVNNDYIKYERENWIEHDKLELYIDFETYNSSYRSKIKNGVVNDDPIYDRIYLIGVGYFKGEKWIFKSFLIDSDGDAPEINNMNNVLKYINKILKENNKTNAVLYHWNHSEETHYNKFKLRNDKIKFKDDNICFYDLLNVFRKEPITIKDTNGYGLKTLGNSLYKHGLINTIWDNNSKCVDGVEAMHLAEKIYNKECDFYDETVMNDIIKYNEIDCKVLSEIHLLMKKY